LRLDGLKNEDVAARVGTSVLTVSMWSSRFEKFGLDDLEDKASRGRNPSIPTKKVERVITEVTRPPRQLIAARSRPCPYRALRFTRPPSFTT
jgi:transposase